MLLLQHTRRRSYFWTDSIQIILLCYTYSPTSKTHRPQKKNGQTDAQTPMCFENVYGFNVAARALCSKKKAGKNRQNLKSKKKSFGAA